MARCRCECRLIMTNRRDILSNYERQLTPDDALATFLFMGTNAAANWTEGDGSYDVVYFPAKYRLPLLNTVRRSTGARGASIMSNAPKRAASKWTINIEDYDEELYDSFKSWLFDRDELRVYAWGDFMVTGYLGEVPIIRPRPKVLTLTFLPEVVYVVKSTIVDSSLWDPTTAHHTFSASLFIQFTEQYGV